MAGPLLVGVLDDLLHVVLHQSIHDVEEVRAIRQPAFRELGGKILHKSLRFLHIRPELLDRQLVEHRHVDVLHIIQAHQGFRTCKHLF